MGGFGGLAVVASALQKALDLGGESGALEFEWATGSLYAEKDVYDAFEGSGGGGDGSRQEDPLKKHSGNVKHTLKEWMNRYKNMSWSEIATEAG